MPLSSRTPGPPGSAQGGDAAGAGEEALVGILGVDAALDGVPALAQVFLPEGEPLAARDADLQLHEVLAGDHLRDRVLDLQARVHLQEVGPPLGVDQELEGARVHGSRPGAPGTPRGSPMRSRSSGVRKGEGLSSITFWCRRWIEHSRSKRWTALPWPSAQDLDLDVARPLEGLLQVDAVVAEGALGLAAGAVERALQVVGPGHQPQALAAAARAPPSA